ncbi:hypothetical protein CW304_09380 [Bacillus sp. UFRGS-B20]|nr:hypothetical protein CW304_09380 [Bacillus sp. UFRGS-B20]
MQELMMNATNTGYFLRKTCEVERKVSLQVELALAIYIAASYGQGLSLSRLVVVIGTRGPGETKLETIVVIFDRVLMKIKKQLQLLLEHRKRYRERRKDNKVFQCHLSSVYNAGKSTLLNRLTERLIR